MRRSSTRSAAIRAAAGLSLSLGVLGCGGQSASQENLAAADPAPAAAGAEAARTESAPPAAESRSGAQNAAATEDLLALARSSANTAPGSAATPNGGPSGASASPAAGSSPPGASGSGGAAPSSGPSGESPSAYEQAQPGPEVASAQPAPGSSEGASPASGASSGDQPLAPGEDTKGGGPYDNPIKSAQTFLAAVKSKDPGKLAEAVALRSVSPMEGATQKHQAKYFKPILERSIEPDAIDELVAMFDGMQIIGKNNPHNTGELGVILGKQEQNGKFATITLYTRKEKAGWKIKDFSQTRVTDHNPYAPPRMPAGRMPFRGRRR